LDCVVYLYPSEAEAEAEDGSRIGGSGFLVGIYLNPPFNTYALRVLVTNKHIVDNGNMVARINTLDGGKAIIAMDEENWIFSATGDDLGICPIKVNPAVHKHNYVPTWTFVTKKLLGEFDVGPGDDVFFVGRFIDREGRQQNLPSARFGNISQMPIEPVILEGGVKQDSFMIEARSIAGYSGSPVFLHFIPQPGLPPNMPEGARLSMPDFILKRQFTQYGIPYEPYLLGIDYCHIFSKDQVFNRHTDKPHDDWYVKSNTGMMGVIPAWKLAAMLEQPEMKSIIESMRALLPIARPPDDM
jgi:hypothetical protein